MIIWLLNDLYLKEIKSKNKEKIFPRNVEVSDQWVKERWKKVKNKLKSLKEIVLFI
jgi:uncharacterized protein with NRDE domain